MASFISIEADTAEVERALSGTSKSLLSIRRQIAGVAARGSVAEIKKAIRTTTTRRTGELAKAYGYKVKRDGSGATVYPKATGGHGKKIVPIVSALSYGAEITTKRRFLQISGEYFARPKSVTIRPRNFVQAGEKYVEGDKWRVDVEKVVERELEKYWG